MKKIISILLCAIFFLTALPLTATEAHAFTGEDKINIVLDPGHGGGNIGASARGIGEKTYTYEIATILKALLEENGNFNVYLTRSGDYDLELYERAVIANDYNADLVLSLHFDGNPSSSVSGVTTYTSVLSEYAATSLSSSIAQSISSATGLSNNGVRQRADTAGYYWNFEKQWDCQDSSLGTLSDYYGIPTWCAKFGIPSIIVEHGYFSNAGDVSIICAEGGIEKIAAAEAEALIAYYTNHNHVYSAAKQDYASNCVYTGKTSEHCSICGHRRNVTSLAPNASNHYWITKSSTPASCGVDGQRVSECRISQNLKAKGWEGELHTNTEIIPAPQDHSYTLIEDVPATHTVDGHQTWKCSTCSSTYSEIFAAEGHTYESSGHTDPTCTADGGDHFTCTVCSDSFTEVIPALGHSYVETGYTEPDCTNKGERITECTTCGDTETETFEPLGHSIEDGNRIEPTCTEDGEQHGYCKRCSLTVTEVLPKKGHTLTVTEDVPPTCTSNGKKVTTCSDCDYEETEISEAPGHTLEHKTVLTPACEREGKESTYCTVCTYTQKTTIPALEHKKSETGTEGKPASLFSAGVMNYPCENGCSKVFTEKIPPVFSGTVSVIVLSIIGAVAASLAIFAIILLVRRNPSAKSVKVKKEVEKEKVTADSAEK